MTESSIADYPYVYRIHGEHFGKVCRLIARGKKNTIQIEMEDGKRILFCSGWAIRKRVAL